MDLRILKTKKSIKEAFLQLRSKKELERIKVKELCDIAIINKTTFYKYYQDIYALSEELENEAIIKVVDAFSAKECLLTDPKRFIAELPIALDSQLEMLEPLFNKRWEVLFMALEKNLLDYYQKDIHSMTDDIRVTFLVGGTFHTLRKMKMANKYSDQDLAEQIGLIIKMSN